MDSIPWVRCASGNVYFYREPNKSIVGKRAVDRRAGQLMEEYRSKADRKDLKLGEESGRGGASGSGKR